jgi:transcriptional regulator with XRE-family HTH domain
MKRSPRLNLKRKRLSRSLTQKQVASFLNISRTYYGQIENGERRPGSELAFAIADFYGEDVRKVLKG